MNSTTTLSSLFTELCPLGLLLAISIFLTIRSLRNQHHHGLPTWPIVGMLPSVLLALPHNVYDWLTDILIAKNGTFSFKGPVLSDIHSVITADPCNVEYALKTKFNNFPKGGYFRGNVGDLLGDGIFSVDAETWMKQRKPASIEFHSAVFRVMTVNSLVELVSRKLMGVMEGFCKREEAVDLQDLLLRLTFDNVCMIAFGVDPGCLRPGLPEIPFAKAFEDATEATTMRFITPTTIWKALRFLRLGFERTLAISVTVVDDFAYSVIKTRQKELSNESTTMPPRNDLLTIFMGLKDEDGKPYSTKFLRDICVNFILAGRDTSSVALAWFFWLLNQNPDVEKKVVEEINGILRERDEGVVDGNHVVFRPEEVKKMEYLQAALSESLRLYPSVPIDHKEVMEDDVFPDGTVLKKGTKVLYSIYSMGRMESIWGKDCREYKPERWLKDGRFVSESAYKFTAFNGGPRLCLGKEFAYYQMKFAAASILQRYRVKVVPNHPVKPKIALTMYLKHGLIVKLERRRRSKIC